MENELVLIDGLRMANQTVSEASRADDGKGLIPDPALRRQLPEPAFYSEQRINNLRLASS